MTPHWPPSLEVRKILRQARQAYHRLTPWERPALDPISFMVLFTQQNLQAITLAGYWPLPPRALAWFVTPPQAQRQKRQSLKNRIGEVVRNVLVEELPAAVAAIRGAGK